MVPRVGCTIPPTVVDSTTFADSPPTMVDSAQHQSTVWPDSQVQSSSEGGITSVQESPRTTAEPAVRQSELDCKHVATFAERRCRFLGCSQALTVPAPLSTVEGAVHSQVNIFQPSDDEMSRSTLSDTKSCEVEEPDRRMLHLTWRQPPSRGMWKAAAHLVEGLGRRVGPVAVGGPVPRAILLQKWSLINVPLIGSEGQTRRRQCLIG